mmetsp:Transcript_58677/g.162260  ORF Transcript_58677/g.162260 Transcript_58677/m.162260 type:complete len:201 (-) Transcript_58677:307-909(-)
MSCVSAPCARASLAVLAALYFSYRLYAMDPTCFGFSGANSMGSSRPMMSGLCLRGAPACAGAAAAGSGGAGGVAGRPVAAAATDQSTWARPRGSGAGAGGCLQVEGAGAGAACSGSHLLGAGFGAGACFGSASRGACLICLSLSSRTSALAEPRASSPSSRRVRSPTLCLVAGRRASRGETANHPWSSPAMTGCRLTCGW